ncbi:hypothetical protein GE061_020352 [Apolygus lucorum]|uniref:Uncharacterized protein n=1 Tax=Apolygus lucorum TaxID=248454 RepID=A0A8S9WJ81_APOLU|nr:hypothetical protein GE061_020352 [Apolygus lucorum]
MRGSAIWLMIAGVIFCASLVVAENDVSEAAAKEFMKTLNEKKEKLVSKGAIVSWAYESNITEENSKIKPIETIKCAWDYAILTEDKLDV